MNNKIIGWIIIIIRRWNTLYAIRMYTLHIPLPMRNSTISVIPLCQWSSAVYQIRQLKKGNTPRSTPQLHVQLWFRNVMCLSRIQQLKSAHSYHYNILSISLCCTSVSITQIKYHMHLFRINCVCPSSGWQLFVTKVYFNPIEVIER